MRRDFSRGGEMMKSVGIGLWIDDDDPLFLLLGLLLLLLEFLDLRFEAELEPFLTAVHFFGHDAQVDTRSNEQSKAGQ